MRFAHSPHVRRSTPTLELMGKTRAFSVVAKIGCALGIGLAASFACGLALRAHSSILSPVRLSEPEWYLVVAVGVLFFWVALWRLFRGGTLQEEAGRFADASLGGDHLG